MGYAPSSRCKQCGEWHQNMKVIDRGGFEQIHFAAFCSIKCQHEAEMKKQKADSAP